eukprot:1160997-Pelagomonas_calceolata.AAC.15
MQLSLRRSSFKQLSPVRPAHELIRLPEASSTCNKTGAVCMASENLIGKVKQLSPVRPAHELIWLPEASSACNKTGKVWIGIRKPHWQGQAAQPCQARP